MKKLIAISIVLLFLSTTIVLGSSQQIISPIEKQSESIEIDSTIDEKDFSLPVFVSALPKIFLTRKPVYILVWFPMFLVNGYLKFDFDDGTYQVVENNIAKKSYLQSGFYQVSVEFDTIFGFKASGRTRVLII
ncbi:MAG TPA: hypothetical protein VKP59_03280 [Candidatus Thermoplasmatota archaeon]|nr:hypothetical protein [Candidatus Thermoplasmatota archaeon]